MGGGVEFSHQRAEVILNRDLRDSWHIELGESVKARNFRLEGFDQDLLARVNAHGRSHKECNDGEGHLDDS